MIARKRRERDKRLRLPRDSAKLLRSARKRNVNTLKSANVYLAPQIHREIRQLLALLPLEGTGLRAGVIEVEEAATVPQETASPILPPTSHLPGLSINQTSFLIPPTSKSRVVLLAQDLLPLETSSLSVSLEVLKDVVASALLLVAANRVHEPFRWSLRHREQPSFWTRYSCAVSQDTDSI